jgi:YidC/Oxa1 family membrane protein insertase
MYDRKTWIVVIACSVLLAFGIYDAQKNAPKPRPAQTEESAQEPADGEVDGGPGDPGASGGALVEPEPDPADIIEPTRFTLENDRTRFTLTTLGGGVESAEMLKQETLHESTGGVILNVGDSHAVGALAEGPDGMERVNYAHVENESVPGKIVVFAARHPSGLIVKKTWTIETADKPGADFLLNLQVDLENPRSAQTQVPLDRYSLYLGRAQPLHEKEGWLTPSGFFWREGGDFHFTKAKKFEDSWLSDKKSQIVETVEQLDYAGVSNQFFATVLKPRAKASGGIWSKASEVTLQVSGETALAVRAGLILPSTPLAPGGRQTLNYQLFMGPKENRMLNRMGDDWGDIMNYGWAIIGFFSRMLNYALAYTHDVVAKVSGPWSWGIAIIVVTILVRGLMWPLYARSNRTMKRMSKLKPEMDKLKEKYPDDPAKVQQEVIGLYRKYSINPVGGCLPMLAQIPIFFGFYRMLQYAVELRGEGFLWLDDLSQPDTVGHILGFPINVLPIIMGLSSFVQMSMMPNTSADKTQMMIMKLMPLMFLVFCYNFAAALALYWTTSNLFSIGQTWLTQRMPEPELKAKSGPKNGKKSFMERMAEAAKAAEEQQKMRKAQGRVIEPKSDDEPKKKRGPRTGG